jgi:hypothetical protein
LAWPGLEPDARDDAGRPADEIAIAEDVVGAETDETMG